MLATAYQHTFPGRINAEFIGMAMRYNQQKQRRKTEENRKKSLESSFLYSEQQEKQLQRTIYSKSVELNRLQSSRMRKLEEIKAKEELSQIRQYQLEQLRSRNNKLREQNRRKLEIARNRLTTMNQEGWSQLKVSLKNQTQSLKKRIEGKLKIKAKQCSLIRERETIGLQRVDSFHKRKNQENLEAYMQRIKQESRIKKQLETKAQRIERDLKKINKSVHLKKNYLNCLDEQISKYRTDVRVYNRTRMNSKKVTEENYQKGYETNAFASMYKDGAKSK